MRDYFLIIIHIQITAPRGNLEVCTVYINQGSGAKLNTCGWGTRTKLWPCINYNGIQLCIVNDKASVLTFMFLQRYDCFNSSSLSAPSELSCFTGGIQCHCFAKQ